jgi:hypothetical protein
MELKAVLALVVVSWCAWAIIHFILWRDDKYLSTEEQIQEMMDETSIPSETLWSMLDRLN